MNDFEPKGIITALITPLKNNKINLLLFEKLLNAQIDARVNGILLFGTTGEGLSLSDFEKRQLFFTAKRIINNRMPIICGISEVCTDKVVHYARTYQNWGADAIMQITPYYYRCNDLGIYKHFKKTADNCKLPLIVYNVPSRTSYDLTKNEKLYNAVCNLKNISAIKIATSNKEEMKNVISKTAVPVLCGCDELNLVALSNNASGCISVVSNAYPKTLRKIYESISVGDFVNAKKLDDNLSEFYNICVLEPNPIPIKYVLSKLYDEEIELRLPLDVISSKNKDKIDDFLNNYKE